MYVACLMAGASTRLLPLTARHHKALLRIGEQRIIDIQMKTFTRAGIDEMLFVVGHGAERIAQHIRACSATKTVSIVHNTHYSGRNLDWSAYLALSSRSEDVIYYEGDIIASPEILRKLAADPADVCLVMDPAMPSARVDTRVTRKPDGTCELAFSEHGNLDVPLAAGAEGEFVCIVKLADRARAYVVERLQHETYLGPMKLYRIFNDLFRVFRPSVISTDGLPWVEIDNHEDLLRAHAVVERIFRN